MIYDKPLEDNIEMLGEMNALVTADGCTERTETDKKSTEEKLVQDLERVFKKHRYKIHTCAKAQMLYNLCNKSDSLFNGKVRQVMINNVLTGKFADIFKLQRILQSINSTSSGTENLLGIDSLRDALRYDNLTEEGHFHIDKN